MVSRETLMKKIEEAFELNKKWCEPSGDEGEASIMMAQAALDGMNKMKNVCIGVIEEEIKEDYPENYTENLAEFKIEILKGLRKEIREKFDILTAKYQSSEMGRDISTQLILMDKSFLNKLASIRRELPEVKP